MQIYFDHEKLIVYQTAIAFDAWAGELLQSIKRRAAVRDQLDRASTSIALNIAEGNGKSSVKERCRFFEISRGSAFECAACLDLLVGRKIVAAETVMSGKEMLKGIVSMLVGLANSLASQIGEEEIEYHIGESN